MSRAKKFYIRSNDNKVDSFETGCIVIAPCFPEVIQKSPCTARSFN